MAFVFFGLGWVGGRAGRCVVVVAAVAVRVAEEAALVVAGAGDVGGVLAGGCVGAGWQVGGWVPLGAAGALLDVVPALAALVPLRCPAGGHGGWSTIGSWRSLGCGRALVVLLGVALGLAVTLGCAILLWRLAILLLRRLAILLLWGLAVLLLRGLAVRLLLRRTTLAATVVALGEATVTWSSTARRCVRVTVGRLRACGGRVCSLVRHDVGVALSAEAHQRAYPWACRRRRVAPSSSS